MEGMAKETRWLLFLGAVAAAGGVMNTAETLFPEGVHLQAVIFILWMLATVAFLYLVARMIWRHVWMRRVLSNVRRNRDLLESCAQTPTEDLAWKVQLKLKRMVYPSHSALDHWQRVCTEILRCLDMELPTRITYSHISKTMLAETTFWLDRERYAEAVE